MVRVPVVHDDVGFLGFLGEEVGAVVGALDNGDVWVGGAEGGGDVAQKNGDGVVGVGGGYGVEDGTADVACCPCAVWKLGSTEGWCRVRFTGRY